MIDPNDPPRGSMYLYDDIVPPTVDGSYQVTVSTNIDYGTVQTAPITQYFDVVGPRFALDPTLVANVFPPRNGQGSYQETLPQIVFSRRTLPWERPIDSASHPLPAPTVNSNPPNGAVPWVALLLLEEGEYTLQANQTLESVVPAGVFAALGAPANILCDAIELDSQLLASILPSREELQLLCHVRQVNVEDRELSAGSSDGFFSVVMSNRLPAPGSNCRACLVSLEQRTDLVRADPPAFEYPGGIFNPPILTAPINVAERFSRVMIPLPNPRLVLLHSWTFTATGAGTFRELMQNLDVGMIGATADGKPQLTDTGHLQLSLLDRSGEDQTVWYRGPLVPWQLTRDTLGPYHSADQCRRATPETGAEDVSYAGAFEVGRQLAVADARLAQELMRWRRESYKQASRADTIGKLQVAITVDLPAATDQKLQAPIAIETSVSAARVLAATAIPLTDRFGINAASKTVGMDAASVSRAWTVPVAQAQAFLGLDPATLGAVVAAPVQTPRPNMTLEQVAADTASLTRLSNARDKLITTATIRTTAIGTPPIKPKPIKPRPTKPKPRRTPKGGGR
jgi:hypothetical protein